MDKLLKLVPFVVVAWLCYLTPSALMNLGKAMAATHPLESYLSVENALILEKFPYPGDCKKEMIEMMGDDGERCNKMWQRRIKELSKYGIKTTADELQSFNYWVFRKQIINEAYGITVATLPLNKKGEVINAHLHSEERLKKAQKARELISAQKKNLKSFKARALKSEG
jgi:hypothetical protein